MMHKALLKHHESSPHELSEAIVLLKVANWVYRNCQTGKHHNLLGCFYSLINFMITQKLLPIIITQTFLEKIL